VALSEEEAARRIRRSLLFFKKLDVRFGSIADICSAKAMSALPPIATLIAYFQIGPIADQRKSMNEWRWDAHSVKGRMSAQGPIEWRCSLRNKDHGRASIQSFIRGSTSLL
jgi:hypothetical protein